MRPQNILFGLCLCILGIGLAIASHIAIAALSDMENSMIRYLLIGIAGAVAGLFVGLGVKYSMKV